MNATPPTDITICATDATDGPTTPGAELGTDADTGNDPASTESTVVE